MPISTLSCRTSAPPTPSTIAVAMAEHLDGREVDAAQHHGLVVRLAIALVDAAKVTWLVGSA